MIDQPITTPSNTAFNGKEYHIRNKKKKGQYQEYKNNRKTQMKDIGYTAKKLNFKYAGHVMRQGDGGGRKLGQNGDHMREKDQNSDQE